MVQAPYYILTMWGLTYFTTFAPESKTDKITKSHIFDGGFGQVSNFRSQVQNWQNY